MPNFQTQPSKTYIYSCHILIEGLLCVWHLIRPFPSILSLAPPQHSASYYFCFRNQKFEARMVNRFPPYLQNKKKQPDFDFTSDLKYDRCGAPPISSLCLDSDFLQLTATFLAYFRLWDVTYPGPRDSEASRMARCSRATSSVPCGVIYCDFSTWKPVVQLENVCQMETIVLSFFIYEHNTIAPQPAGFYLFLHRYNLFLKNKY